MNPRALFAAFLLAASLAGAAQAQTTGGAVVRVDLSQTGGAVQSLSVPVGK